MLHVTPPVGDPYLIKVYHSSERLESDLQKMEILKRFLTQDIASFKAIEYRRLPEASAVALPLLSGKTVRAAINDESGFQRFHFKLLFEYRMRELERLAKAHGFHVTLVASTGANFYTDRQPDQVPIPILLGSKDEHIFLIKSDNVLVLEDGTMNQPMVIVDPE